LRHIETIASEAGYERLRMTVLTIREPELEAWYCARGFRRVLVDQPFTDEGRVKPEYRARVRVNILEKELRRQ
jgi:hypothetical protein